MENDILKEFIQEKEENAYRYLEKDRDLLTALKEDTENFTEEEKKAILYHIKNNFHSPSYAIERVLNDRIREKGTLEIMDELFPDIMKEI